MAWPAADSPPLPDCWRLRSWLSEQDAHGTRRSAAVHSNETGERLAAAAQLLRQARSPLLWIESADVAATRAAVRLAEACGATVHVASSPGAQNVASVAATCGTFGTSLAEVAAHADLVVHIGHRHLQELPLLAPRFLQARASVGSPHPQQHVFIGDQPISAWPAAELIGGPAERIALRWPRELWLEHLTRVLMAARGNLAISQPDTDRASDDANQLAELLAASRYSVIMWDEDEFADQLDRILIERLFQVAQAFSQTTRCSLLPLGSDPGRVTSQETLLWLTNIAGPARYVDGQWIRGLTAVDAALDDWQTEHDWILCLRNLPSDRPLPDLRFHLIIDAACNARLGSSRSAENEAAGTVQVAGVGIETRGHLFRLDHAFAARTDGVIQHAEPRFAAEQILRTLMDHVLAGRGH